LDGNLAFAALPRSELVTETPAGEAKVLRGFLGMSEGGIIYSRGKTGVCTAGGARVVLPL
jgi:hypothetical protein